MADIFVSYARPDEPHAERVAEALRAAGYRVWRDDELPAHRAYAEVIEERLKSAKAVVVLWSAEAAKSQWVRAEADAARDGRHAGPGDARRHDPAAAVQPDPVRRPQGLGRRAGRRPAGASLPTASQRCAGGADPVGQAPSPGRASASCRSACCRSRT